MRPAFQNTNTKGSIATSGLPMATMLAVMVGSFLGLTLVPTAAAAYQAPQEPASATKSAAPSKPKAQEEDQWRVIAPSDALATVEMPKKPRYIERTFTPVANKPPIKVHLHLATVNEGKTTYIFGYHDLHEAPDSVVTRDKALEGAVRGSVVNVQGELLSDVTKIRFKNSMGRQFQYQYVQDKKSYIVASRVFIVGKRQYQISALSLQSALNETLVAKYINSFKLLMIENDEPPVPRLRK